ncbi:peptide chain release factor N(5)-glutamine methyltransferase [Mucilaginibacter lacusdianchii]|uniref:peptide chain release factor N(5)-glutamine methyltransferase n=1 Tax=Mucilaginibacter lacusdianchii TaxID=2684211 RepID=UPI00131D40A2|nr:peptide chain release factor N(5)-glutamine methyltransferase [Mucilaginibacter sp. JXJ CY 39]
MKTVKDVYNQYRTTLRSIYDDNEINSITDIVLQELTAFSRAKLKAFTDAELTVSQFQAAEKILADLQTGKPVQYIIGHTGFYGLTFQVNPSVLIPRPETEELVEWVLETVNTSPNTTHCVLDIGTGSGCIAVSIKVNLPVADVSAIDISTAALKTAKQNAQANNAEINFIEADILNAQDIIANEQQYTIIVSNPPYVTPTDKTQMHINVMDFEPHTALFVPEEDPLLFYKAIADYASSHLVNHGHLLFEINESYGKQTVDMLTDKGFKNIELRKDMSSRDRMIKAAWLN